MTNIAASNDGHDRGERESVSGPHIPNQPPAGRPKARARSHRSHHVVCCRKDTDTTDSGQSG